jgi:hypothetical protein
MSRALIPSVTRLIAADMASAASTETAAAVHRARTVTSPRATGLSVRPAALSSAASQASLDQPTESWPASIAGAVSTGPMPCGAASAASTVTMAVIARLGPG